MAMEGNCWQAARRVQPCSGAPSLCNDAFWTLFTHPVGLPAEASILDLSCQGLCIAPYCGTFVAPQCNRHRPSPSPTTPHQHQRIY
jgi:hypothetical protein